MSNQVPYSGIRTDPPSDEQLVFDALKSIPGSSPHRSPAWYALNRILRDRDGAEDMLGFDYDSVVRTLIADRDNWRASGYAERQMRLAAERGRDWFKDSLKQEHANVERLVKEKNALLVILADARYEERTENETASLVDQPPHTLLAREGTTEFIETIVARLVDGTLNLEVFIVSSPSNYNGGEKKMMLEIKVNDPAIVAVRHTRALRKAELEVIRCAFLIADADPDETYPWLHKAVRQLERAQGTR